MERVTIKVTSVYSDVGGMQYGPFESKGDAQGHLRALGWTESLGEIWLLPSRNYLGIKAKIEPLLLPADLPSYQDNCVRMQIPVGKEVVCDMAHSPVPD